MRGVVVMAAAALCIGAVSAELDLFTRFSRQLGGEEGAVSLGLVSALQKWANSLESEISGLRSEMVGLKNSNIQLVKEMQQVKSSNLNLRNDVSAANERTLNLKDNYMKASEEIEQVKAENKGLLALVLEHKDVITIQIEEAAQRDKAIAELRSNLFQTNSGVSKLKGNIDASVSQHAAQLTSLTSRVGDLDTQMHDLNGNLSRFVGDTSTSLSTININLEDIRAVHAKTMENAAVNLNQTMVELNTRVGVNAQTILDKHASLDKKTESALQNYKAQTLAFVSNLNQQLENVGARVEQSRQRMGEVDDFKEAMNGKVSELLTDNSILIGKVGDLESKLEKFNRSHSEGSSMQMSTMKGLERLGDSLATLKGDIIGTDYIGQIYNLTQRIDLVETKVEPVADRIIQIDRVEQKVDVLEEDLDSLQAKVDVQQVKLQNVGSDSALLKSSTEKQVDSLRTSLTNTRNTLAQLLTKVSSLESQGTGVSEGGEVAQQVTTLKTNVIGLGNYINSVNRELNNLSSKTKASVELFSSKISSMSESVSSLTKSVSLLETEVESTKRSTSSLKTNLASPDFSASTLRTEVSGLSSKLYSLKTSVFELSNDVTLVKSGLSTVGSDVAGVKKELKKVANKASAAEQASKNTKTDVSNLRAGLTGLTSNLFAAKSDIEKIAQVEKQVSLISENVTSISNLASSTLSDLNELRPEVNLLGTDLSSFRTGMARLTRAVTSVSDPARFSCGVTGEEIKVSGVIVYDECTVNTGTMMNKGTGHATVPLTGDYVLSFSASLVSVDSQAIWCALYKQSPGDEGWQVLGMINNYQSDAGEEDDRDSSSLTILASLKEGDQVWVEWRGYEESFLYSNLYKLISFSGYMITGTL